MVCDRKPDWSNNRIKRSLAENDSSQETHSSPQKKFKQSICLKSRLSEPKAGGAHFTFEPPLLADFLHDKRVWRGETIDATVGFVMTCSHEMSDSELVNCIEEKILGHSRDNIDAESMPSHVGPMMRRAVYEFLCTATDTFDHVIDSVSKFNSSTSEAGDCDKLAGEIDLRWWNINPDRRDYYRRLTYFRRLMRPICVKVLQQQHQQRDGKTAFVVYKSNLSLLQILLDLPSTQEYAIDAILMHICCLPEEDAISALETKFLRNLIKKINEMVQASMVQDMTAYQDIATFVCSVRPDLEDKLPSVRSDDYDRSVTNKLKSRVWQEYIDRVKGKVKALSKSLVASSRSRVADSKSCDPTRLEGRRKYLKRRQEMIDEHAKRKSDAARQSSRKIVPMGRDADGSITYTDQDMSLPEFIDEMKFMETVNNSFPRYCNPEQSRPRMQQVQLSDEKVAALKTLIFDSDGSLSDKIKHDVDTSAKHGYINFTNLLCHKERKDQRWQVPIRKHGAGSVITTRAAAENILTGVFDPRHEALYDLGILIGGTEDQSLHHDVARQCVSWIPEKHLASDGVGGMNPVGGWEIDRLAYNEAMSSPNAPSSVLIGMGDAEEVLLGVQKDQIIRCKKNSNMCRVLGGKKDQRFEIVRENEFLVVLRAKTGVMFTGDFPHAGVRNVKVGSRQDNLLRRLNGRIASVLEQYPDQDRLGQTRAIVAVLCNFPDLDKLCRLHCSTEITTGNLLIPANTIGFCDCLANPPDARCLEDDTPPTEEEQEQPEKVIYRADDFSEDDDSSDEEAEWVDDGDVENEWVDNESDSVPTLCSSNVGENYAKLFADF